MAAPTGGGRRLCGARTRAGGSCKRAPSRGRNRCDRHGGKSPRGAASPQYKHGIYAQALTPDELEVWADVQVNSLEQEIKFQAIVVRRAALKLLEIEDAGSADYETAFEPHEQKEEVGLIIDGDEKRTGLRPSHRIKRRPDFRAIHDRAIGRLGSLMMQHAELTGGITGTPEDIARQIKASVRAMIGDMDSSDTALDPT